MMTDTGNYNFPGPFFAQLFPRLGDSIYQTAAVFYMCQRMIVYIRKQAQLSKVRGDDISLKRQPAHLPAELFREHGICIAVVSHDGVHDEKGPFFVERLYKIKDMPYLPLACDKAGIYAVKMDIHLFPLEAEVFHLVGIVIPVIARISCLSA